MKSSGVGTEYSEPDKNPDPDSDLMEQFVKLSESIQQIELQHHSGFTCLFIVESLAEEFKAQNQELKVQLSELQSKFNGIQMEYDCLSSELMESLQESEALREELKQRQSSYDLESIKSSGVGTEYRNSWRQRRLGVIHLKSFRFPNRIRSPWQSESNVQI